MAKILKTSKFILILKIIFTNFAYNELTKLFYYFFSNLTKNLVQYKVFYLDKFGNEI